MVRMPDHYCKQHYEHEAEYLASRQRWARSYGEYSHKYNTVTRNRDQGKRDQYNFYRTKQWSHLRQSVLERDNYLCQYCKAQGIIKPAKTADHIVPIEYDASIKTSVNNIANICTACHRLKTDWERDYYGTGQGNVLKSVKAIKDIMVIAYLMQKKAE